MAHIAVIGAGVGGLGAALALSRRGHDITLIERDATPMPVDPHHAFEWDRRGAPQVRHSHAFLARLRNLLRDDYPDVLAAMFDAGATEIRFADMPPPGMEGFEPEPGDDDLVALACRRTTFEWVLRRAALDSDRVQLRDGVGVDGLLFAPDTGDLPRVTGVRLAGPGTPGTLAADAVVAANGRRSPLHDWLAPAGVTIDEDEEDTGIIYLSRFYRLHDGADLPDQEGPIGGDLGYLKYAVFQGDNRTFSVTFAARTGDDELRRLLLDPDRFDNATAALPATARWTDPARAEATTEVFVMAKLVNRIRRFTADETPLVLGLHALGDAHTCTNPLYGRGCTLAMIQADLLADSFDRHPDDPRARALDYETASGREIEPWYLASVASDRQGRLAAERERRERRGEDTTDLDEDPMTMAGSIMRDGLLPAVRTDPEVFRAFIRMFNLLDDPEAFMTNTTVMARVLEAYQVRDERAPEEPLGPKRREMLDLLSR